MSVPIVFGSIKRFAGLHRHVERDADLCLCADCIAKDKTGRRRLQLIREIANLKRRFASSRFLAEVADAEEDDAPRAPGPVMDLGADHDEQIDLAA